MPNCQLKNYKVDLHIHSCLSPCGDWDMSPRRIVQQSLEVGLDLIAICDHNTVENAGAAVREGRKKGLPVLPGMEVCSREEVHMLAIFGELSQALSMQSYVYAHLPGENKPGIFGCQVVANEDDEVLGENPRLLIGATRLGLHDIASKTHLLGGSASAARSTGRLTASSINSALSPSIWSRTEWKFSAM